jgi:predicted DNA-binding transcriptional regulator YafY
LGKRNKFKAARATQQILKRLRDGDVVSISEVQEDYGVQYQQARAYLKLLEELHGLVTSRDGRQKVWAFSEKLDSPNITLVTAAALEYGGVAMDLFEDTPYEDELDDVIDYARSRVPDRQQDRYERLSKVLHHRRTWLPRHRKEVGEHLETLLDSVCYDDPFSFEYRRSDGEVQSYVAKPGRIIWYHGRLWMLATDFEETKLFDIAGISESHRGVDETLLKNTLSRPEQNGGDSTDETEGQKDVEQHAEELAFGHDLDNPSEFFSEAYGIFAENYPVQDVHLEVFGSWKTYLDRYRIHSSQENEVDEENDSLHVRFEIGLCPEFKSFILGMIPQVEIHEPKSLKQDLKDRAASWVGG